jgi:hypothetical protein
MFEVKQNTSGLRSHSPHPKLEILFSEGTTTVLISTLSESSLLTLSPLIHDENGIRYPRVPELAVD